MFDGKHEDGVRNSVQIKAVDRLLEVAQKKSILDDNWHSGQRMKLSFSFQMRSHLPNRRQIKREKQQLSNRMQEKEQLRRLIGQSIDNQETYLYQKQLPKIAEKELPSTLATNFKLPSFRSHINFYSPNKKVISSSLTFYPNKQKAQQSQLQPPRYGKQILFSEKKNGAHRNIVYFKPNKSETIRELLNQMKLSKLKNNLIVLNSKQEEPTQEQEDQFPYLRQNQMKEFTRYKNFIPFREDDNILMSKFREGQNIWKRRFKQSWQRRKEEVEGKRSYFKRLIVKD